MPSLSVFISLLENIKTMERSDVYDLRIVASLASKLLYFQEELPQRREIVQNVIPQMREMIKPFIKDDPHLDKIYKDLGEWYLRFRPGPRSFEENARDNPIVTPDGGVPGAFIHQWAIKNRRSSEFSEELQDHIAWNFYGAKTPEEVDLYLQAASAIVRDKGSVFVGTSYDVTQLLKRLDDKDIPFDAMRVAGVDPKTGKDVDDAMLVWVPKDQRQEALDIVSKMFPAEE